MKYLSALRPGVRPSALAAATLAMLLGSLATPAGAIVSKAPSPLDAKALVADSLHGFPAGSPLAEVIDRLPNADAWRRYQAAHPKQEIFVDATTGRATAAGGAGIPWIPGLGNSLTLSDIAWAFDAPKSEPGRSELETIARRFLADNADVFRIPAGVTLALGPDAAVRVSDSHWSLWFDASWNGIPIRGGAVLFQVKQGNLVQWGTVGLDDVDFASAAAPVDAGAAWNAVGAFVGGFLPGVDVQDGASERTLLPERSGALHGYRDVWEIRFRRTGELGTWLGRVDARSGQVVEFVDANEYAQVRGGVYPLTNTAGSEVSRPLAFADWSTGKYADSAGFFSWPGGTATSKLAGKYVKMSDTCGSILLQTSVSPGDLDFGASSGTDCSTPGTGGPGNTHASRSCYYHTDQIKQKGRAYLSGNSWLYQQLQANVNINSTCNAYWDGTNVNFFKSGGGCGNTGEIAGVFLHEWGHGMDQNDGNGSQGSGEAMGDTVAMLHLRNSCLGPGFFGSNCSGYGNPCLNCTGVRDQDRYQHQNNIIVTPANIAARCSSSGSDPCGREGHCEAQLAGNTVWDLAYRDLPARADLATEDAWQLADKLWWESGPTRTYGYTCSNKTGAPWNNGCGATTWYQTFLVADDDDGNLANGTPHATTIFAVFDRHGISCGVAGDAKNIDSTSCPTITAIPVVSAVAGNNSVTLTWNRSIGAANYRVLRNAAGCNTGFVEIARVADSGATVQSWTDTSAANGPTWYYRLQPIGSNVDCAGPTSDCASATPGLVAEARVRPGSAVQTADTGDNDGFPDNCETVTVRLTVENSGTAPLTGARIVELGADFTGVTILTPLPIAVGSLAVGASTDVTFQYRLGDGVSNAACGQRLGFRVVATADQMTASSAGVFSFVAEQDRTLTASKSWSFEGNMDGWTVIRGTFAPSTTVGGAAGSWALVSSNGRALECDEVQSPVFQPTASTTLDVATNFLIQYAGGSVWYDRANLAVIDVATGVRTVLVPTTGRTYQASGSGGACQVQSQAGWAGNNAQWADSGGFDLTPWAGKDVVLDLVYGTDASTTGAGFRFDNVRLGNAYVVGCDAQPDVCSTCTAAPVIRTAPVPQTACLGGSATFSVVALGATGYQWNKNGSPIGGATSSTLTLSPLTLLDADVYSVDVTNGCGTTSSTAVGLDVLDPTASPAAPTSLVPADGATDVALATTLSWAIDSLTTRSKLYLGTTNPPPFYTEIGGPGSAKSVWLMPGTTYYWKVTAYPIEGPAPGTATAVQSFTTTATGPSISAVTPTVVNRWAGPVTFTVDGTNLAGTVGFDGGIVGSFSPTSSSSTSITGTLTPVADADATRLGVTLTTATLPDAGMPQALVVRAFSDVTENDFYFDSSYRMVDDEIMPSWTGAGGPEFRPTILITRGDMAEYLVKAHFHSLSQPVPVRDCYLDFPDVACSDPQRLYIEWAKDLGITLGAADGNFYPSTNVTRAEMAAFLDRLNHGGDASVPKCVADPGWSDLASIPAWALPYINALRSDRITAGCSASPLTYCPFGTVQRSEIATFLSRVLGATYLP